MLKKRKEVDFEPFDIKETVITVVGVVIVLGIYGLGAWGVARMFESWTAVLIYSVVCISLCVTSLIILELWGDDLVYLSFGRKTWANMKELERLKAEEKKRSNEEFNKEYNALTDEDWKHPDMILGTREYMWRKKHKCRTGDEREDCDNNYYRGKP